MVAKRLTAILTTALGIAFLCSGCITKKETSSLQTTEDNKINPAVAQTTNTPKAVEKKHDLYSETSYDLPLYSVVEISRLPNVVKETVDKILELSQGFYLLRNDGERVLIILQNPVEKADTYQRHELQFAEINMNGQVKYHTAGYAGLDGEINNSIEQTSDDWVFDETFEPKRPIKHIAYNENGKIKFIELWNYDDKDPIKYQMKDSAKKVLSIMKETQDNDSNYRREHIFYDNEGKTKMSLTINYDGANISRMTFYNSHDSIDSMSILTDYIDGVKVKEQVYNEDYELINTVTSNYTNGTRKNIVLYDNEGIEICRLGS